MWKRGARQGSPPLFSWGAGEGRGGKMRSGEAEQEPFQWVFSGGCSISGHPWVSNTAPGMLCMVKPGGGGRCLRITPQICSLPKHQPLALLVPSCPDALTQFLEPCSGENPKLPSEVSSGPALPSAPTFPGLTRGSEAFQTRNLLSWICQEVLTKAKFTGSHSQPHIFLLPSLIPHFPDTLLSVYWA